MATTTREKSMPQTPAFLFDSAAGDPPELGDDHECIPKLGEECQKQAFAFNELLKELTKTHESVLAENRALRQRVAQGAFDYDGNFCRHLSRVDLDYDKVCSNAEPEVKCRASSSLNGRTGSFVKKLSSAPCNRIQERWGDLVTKLQDNAYGNGVHIVRPHWERCKQYELEAAQDEADVDVDLCQVIGDTYTVQKVASFNSNHDMMRRKERTRYCRRPSTMIIDPSSNCRGIWVCTSLFLMLYDAVILSLQVYQNLDNSSFVKAMELVSLIFWTLDIAISFITGVYVDGELHMRPAIIAKHYLRSWFSFDALVVSSMWVSAWIESDEKMNRFGVLIRTAKMARYLRIVRIAKLQGGTYMMEVKEWAETTFGTLTFKIAKFFVGMFLWVHLSGCIWYALGSGNEHGWVHVSRWEASEPALLYVASLHWAVAQLQGSTDITPGSTLQERVFAVFAVITSIIILATCVSRLTNIMIELQSMSTKAKQDRSIREYLHSKHISLELRLRIRTYIECIARTGSSTDDSLEQEVLSALPQHLRRLVITEVRSPHISGNPVFLAISEVHGRFFERICCDVLRVHHAMPDEQLWVYAEKCNDVYFMTRGACLYTKYNSILKALAGNAYSHRRSSRNGTAADNVFNFTCKNGTCLAETVLWTDWFHRGDLLSMQHSTYLTLNELQFQHTAKSYGPVLRQLTAYAKQFVEFFNGLNPADKSDLWGSTLMMQRTVLPRARFQLMTYSNLSMSTTMLDIS